MADAPSEKTLPGKSGSVLRLLIVASLVAFAILCGVCAWFIYRVTGPVSTTAITRQFSEYLPTVGPADGILETATSSVPETFTQTDSASILDIPLGTTVSEIRVPAVYRYHIRLYDPWKLVMSGQVCVVFAPQFQPSLPPAIITADMEKSTSSGWLRFDADENLDALERSITGELEKRANDKLHRDYVREACRQSVAQFVKRWLMKEHSWPDDHFHQIVVVFPDEVTSGPGVQSGQSGAQVTIEGLPHPSP